MSELVVSTLGAMVRVLRRDPDGNVMKEHLGFNAKGEPILQDSVRFVNLHRGDQLPDDLAPGELDRLTADNVVRRKAAVHVIGASSSTGGLSVDNLADHSVEELAGWIGGDNPPTVKALLDAVGDDKELAAKVLEAEKTGLKGDARKSLVAKLEKVVTAD